MGGFFGVVGKGEIVEDLFYGTDYHTHLGTKRGGLAVGNGAGIVRYIHNIENAQFRSKFEEDIVKLRGTRGIGVISDYEDQPLLIRSHLGNFSIASVGVIKNIDDYAKTGSDKYETMIDRIARTLRLTTLRYQRLEDLVAAIGLPKEKLCTFCWDGVGTD